MTYTRHIKQAERMGGRGQMIELTISGNTYNGIWNHIQDWQRDYKDSQSFVNSVKKPTSRTKRGKGWQYTHTFETPEDAMLWIDCVKSQGDMGLWQNASNSDALPADYREWASMRRDAKRMILQLQAQGVKVGIQHPG